MFSCNAVWMICSDDSDTDSGEYPGIQRYCCHFESHGSVIIGDLCVLLSFFLFIAYTQVLSIAVSTIANQVSWSVAFLKAASTMKLRLFQVILDCSEPVNSWQVIQVWLGLPGGRQQLTGDPGVIWFSWRSSTVGRWSWIVAAMNPKESQSMFCHHLRNRWSTRDLPTCNQRVLLKSLNFHIYTLWDVWHYSSLISRDFDFFPASEDHFFVQ